MMANQFGPAGTVVLMLLMSLPCVSQTPVGEIAYVPNQPPTPKNVVLYTGQLDGLLGSMSICHNQPVANCDKTIKDAAGSIQEYKKASRGVLVGMGDNFGPFGFDPNTNGAARYVPQTMLRDRLQPDYSNNPMIKFVGDAYDAVVPGREDFSWGVEYLRRMTDSSSLPATVPKSIPVPFIANNLVTQALPDPVCRSYPSPTAVLPLLPNQVSAPITASASSGAGASGAGGASSGAGGGGGKGKGKGGGKGGTAGGGAAGGAAAGAAGGAGACPSQGAPGGAASAAGAAGATTSASVGNTILTRKQAELINRLPRPSLVYPESSAIYPWTFSIALSVPKAAPDQEFAIDAALVCPADNDPSDVDKIRQPAQCVTWYFSRPLPATFGEIESNFVKSVQQAMDLARATVANLSANSKQGATPPPTPSSVLPVTQTVRFTLVKNEDTALRTELVPVDGNGFILNSSSEITRGLEGLHNQEERKSEPKAEQATGILFPGNSVKICLALKPPVTDTASSSRQTAATPSPSDVQSRSYRCTASPVSVQRTVFQRAWITASAGGPQDYVIFGALASDTLNGVSDANKSMAPAILPSPARNNPTMQANVNDPASAISQALTAFNQLHPHQKSVGIVLAQMTASEAKSLSDSLGSTAFEKTPTQIDMIMAQADPVETSPRATFTVSAPTKEDPQRFIPVISPSPIFQREDCLKHELAKGDCLATADVAFDKGITILNNTPARISSGRTVAFQKSPAPSSSNTFCDNEGTKTTWECQVLVLMRDAFHDQQSTMNPEIAILEARDFDYVRGRIQPDIDIRPNPANLTPNPEQVSEALWNAGNLTRVTLLGSSLTAILNQNRSNQSHTYQTIASVQQSQQLRILGIFQVGQTYYVNGIPLDSTKLYSVATSDNLAIATSDYSSLASIDQNPPEVFWKHHQTLNIADIVYQHAHNQTPLLLTQVALEAPYSGQIGFNDRKQAAPQLTPFALSLTHSTRSIPPKSVDKSLSQPGEQTQLEPFLHVAIQQLSVGFSNSRPSQNDQLIGSNLGGVSNPNVVSPHSDTLSAVADARVEHYFRRDACHFCIADVGIDGQANFTRSIQGSTTPTTPTMTTSGTVVPTTSVSFPANNYLASPFLEVQEGSFWKPIVLRPAFVTANVASVKQFLPSGDTKLGLTPSLDFELDQKRAVSVGEGVGTRFEASDFNYVEAGFVYQRSYNVLSEVSVGQMSCQINSATSLSTCAGTLPAIAGVNLAPSYSTYSQKGGYLLSSYTQEFPKNPFKKGYRVLPYQKALFLYQGTAFGNFFAYGGASTSSALTRYAFSMNNTFQVQLPANFSFGPSYNWFFFQANQHGIGSSLHRSSVSAQLNYSFDWHSGESFNKSFFGKVQ